MMTIYLRVVIYSTISSLRCLQFTTQKVIPKIILASHTLAMLV